MKKSPALLQTKPQQADSTTFKNCKNPRWKRAINILANGEISRVKLDDEIGCTNSPELISQLRKRGFDCPCDRRAGIDRDGRKCRYGVYYFTDLDRQLASEWLIDGIQ
jgi:hypothetical protein